MNLTLVTDDQLCANCHKRGRYRVTFKRGNTVVLCATHSTELVNALAMVSE